MQFIHIPDELWGKIENENKEQHDRVYRLVKNIDLTYKDFLPTNVEHPERENFNTLSSFSVSLFSNRNSLDSLRQRPTFKSFYVALGKTDINKGVCSIADSKGHINYYLYDYEYNSPCSDFEVSNNEQWKENIKI